MPAQLKSGQSVTATITQFGPKDPITGVAPVITPPVAFDAPPTWAVDNAAIATVTAAADGLSAVIANVTAGQANITLTGVVAGATLTSTDFVTDQPVAPTVASLGIAFGTPTP